MHKPEHSKFVMERTQPAVFRAQRWYLCLVIVALAFGCTNKPGPPADSATSPSLSPRPSPPSATAAVAIRFVDVTPDSGIDWTAQNGEEAGLFTILESFGAGCAIDDYDRDGSADLFFTGGGRFDDAHRPQPVPMALYRRVAKWQYAPVTELAGLHPLRHYHHGVFSADVDHDGFPDLLITGYAGLQFFRNQGDGTFTDSTPASGLQDSLWSLAAAWGDLNGDQNLDLFVGHYVDWSPDHNFPCVDTRSSQRVVCDPTRFNGLPCSAFLSNGDGTFRDASHELGLEEVGKTLGIVIVDLNDDGRPDIYVANDTLANQLYEAQPTGGFREVGIASGAGLGETGSSDGSMGVDVGDLDGDGRLDLWVANFENQSFALYRNLGNGLFLHASRPFGVTAVGAEAVGFGTVLFDADGDGWLDVYCANGHITAPNGGELRRQYPYLFRNVEGKRLENIAPHCGPYLTQRHLARGLACGDLDENGTPDLVITHTNEPVSLLRNETPITNWLAIELIGTRSPRSAIGSRVTVTAGGRQQIGLVKGGTSYLSTSDRTLLFGLGEATTADQVEILWPSGQVEVRKNLVARQKLQVIEKVRD